MFNFKIILNKYIFLKIKNPNKKNFESKNVDADNELLNLISLTEYDGAIAINLKDGYEIGIY